MEVLQLIDDDRYTPVRRLGQAQSYHCGRVTPNYASGGSSGLNRGVCMCNKLVCTVYQVLSSELFLLKISCCSPSHRKGNKYLVKVTQVTVQNSYFLILKDCTCFLRHCLIYLPKSDFKR